MMLAVLVGCFNGNGLLDFDGLAARFGFALKKAKKFLPKSWGLNESKAFWTILRVLFDRIAAIGAVHAGDSTIHAFAPSVNRKIATFCGLALGRRRRNLVLP